MPSEQTTTPCAPGIVTERNRYFTGKYMTARDFASEQDYILGRHQLHNRLLHGWGVVCGLRVVTHPTSGCEEGWVRVRAGIAIDCHGRELFLQQDKAVELPAPPSAPTPSPMMGKPVHVDDEPEEPSSDEFHEAQVLMMRYVERPIEYMPVLYNEGTCDAGHQEANRVREEVCLEWVAWDGLSPDCWKLSGGSANSPCHKDCDDPITGPAGICLEPDCACGGGVPLALLTYAFGDDHSVTQHIDMEGRRHLPMAPDLMTHIVHVNWDHGGDISLAKLRNANEDGGLNGRMEIHFDRPLKTENEAHGVNNFTFEVQYRGVQRDYESLPGEVTVDEEGRVAIFQIDPYYLGKGGRGSRENIAGHDLLIKLRCDFIIDCLDNPVDGEHLRGRLPSGNGTPGGTFMSWFSVTSTDEQGSG